MGLLSGIRALDMADEKGAFCGRMLSELGADVLRLEPPEGARSRARAPLASDESTSLYFAVRNAGKRGVALDWRDGSKHESLHRLLETCDIWIESERPGVLAAHGLAPEEVIARHPALIVTSVTDFGQTGPYRDWQGTDMIGFAMGGMMSRAGIPEKAPLVAPGALAYDAAGITAGYATLLAYWQRLRSGRGQHVDVSVFESVANLSDWSLPNYSSNGGIVPRAGAGMYPVYRCADGFVRMIILVKHHWEELLDWMGRPEELEDPELKEFVPRLLRQAEIDPVLQRFFAGQNKLEAASEAQRRGLPATPVLEPGEVLDNEHTLARETFRSLPVGKAGEARIPAGFFYVNGKRARVSNGAPAIGQHTDEVFSALDGAKQFEADALTSAMRPLEGLRVLDLGIGAVGVEIGRLFAEYGADVVKIENSKHPDFIRTIMGTMMNPSFASSSRSKRSLGIDLKNSQGLEILEALVKKADILVENNAAGVMDRLGLGYERLHEINPRLIMFSSNMTGSQGPWKHWVGYGPSTHPLGGLQWLWNHPEDVEQPAGSTNVHPDHLVGRVGSMGIMAALIGRERSGTGAHVEAAQFETIIHMLGDVLARESQLPGSVQPLGNASTEGSPWGVYPCQGDDVWCAINIRSDEDWQSLCSALGDPDWSKHGNFTSVQGRRESASEIDRHLGEWTSSREARVVMENLQAHRVPAGVLAKGNDLAEDPHLKARGFLCPVDQPPLGELTFEGPAFRAELLGKARVDPAPMLGAHTREVCREWLSFDDAEIDRWLAEKVLEESA